MSRQNDLRYSSNCKKNDIMGVIKTNKKEEIKAKNNNVFIISYQQRHLIPR
jgi:hypothetical protein